MAITKLVMNGTSYDLGIDFEKCFGKSAEDLAADVNYSKEKVDSNEIALRTLQIELALLQHELDTMKEKENINTPFSNKSLEYIVAYSTPVGIGCEDRSAEIEMPFRNF